MSYLDHLNRIIDVYYSQDFTAAVSLSVSYWMSHYISTSQFQRILDELKSLEDNNRPKLS